MQDLALLLRLEYQDSLLLAASIADAGQMRPVTVWWQASSEYCTKSLFLQKN